MKSHILIILIGLFVIFAALPLAGQTLWRENPLYIYPAIIENGDTVAFISLPEIYVYPPYRYKSARDEENYKRMVRDVKKVLPFAKKVNMILLETYEFIQHMPEKQQQAHLKRMEKELYAEYFPVLKTFSFSQGKLMIRLIDRECNQSSFALIDAFLGGFRASFWNVFGGLFGVSLKSKWEPQGKDALLERVCRQVEAGAL